MSWLPEMAHYDAERKCIAWPDKLRFPRYPIFVPSKGRAHNPLTIRFLQLDEVPFRVVVVPEEVDQYLELVREDQILVLPRSDLRLVGTRNWIRDVAEQEGFAAHWQLDDNIRRIWRLWREAKRFPCDSGPALRQVEDFADRYENVGIAGLSYEMFGLPNLTPYFVNCHVYSATLTLHSNPYRWRLRYNDDTDFCLQTLGGGLCTVAVNVFLQEKAHTMAVKGGNTDDLYVGVDGYDKGGRWLMARSLEVMWPDIVKVERRFKRPQHVIDWRRFRQRLELKAGVDLSQFTSSDDYGLRLVQAKENLSPEMERVLSEAPA